MTTLLPPRLSDSPSDQLVRRVGRARAQGRVIGVEHEFGVFEGEDQIDFRDRIHDLDIPGLAHHPTNPHMYFTNRGAAIIADGVVAEIATPPIDVAHGCGTSVANWAEAARTELTSLVGDSVRLLGGSTHISISTDPAHNDRVAVLYARTFAAGLMLLMDQPHSPGLLVRPRPGRLELCGEFVVGASLTDAAVFALGSVACLEKYAATGRGPIPPFLDVELQNGRRRYGWYIDRRAFGTDLYGDGRRAQLRQADGRVVSAQDFLANAWRLARPFAEEYATPAELASVDRVVSGADPLPMEAGSYGEVPQAPAWSNHPLAAASSHLTSRHIRLVPRNATWDWVAWEASSPDGSVVVSVPRRGLARFVQQFEKGRLDGPLTDAISREATLPALAVAAQTAEIGLFSSIRTGPALMPVDRYGIGNAAPNSVRPGKRDLPPPERPGGIIAGLAGPWGLVAAATVVVGLIAVALSLLGVLPGPGDDGTGPADDCVGTECVGAVAEDCGGAECSGATEECVGAACDDVNEECVGEDCAGAVEECVGSDCTDVVEECVGQDCDDVAEDCSGSDCVAAEDCVGEVCDAGGEECSGQECSELPEDKPFDCGGDDCQDARAHLLAADALVFPDDGSVWLVADFAGSWGPGPPDDLFSYFVSLNVVIDGSSAFLGWQTHDGVAEPYGPHEAFVLDDGDVVFATGLFAADGWTGTVSAETGSWIDESATTAVFDSFGFLIGEGSSIAFEDLEGAIATYDLVTGEPIEPPPPPIEWHGVETALGVEAPVAGLSQIEDETGDLMEYYGTFDPSRPDVMSVDWGTIEFGVEFVSSDRMDRLETVCFEGLGAGTAPLCPQNLDILAGSEAWVWLDIFFTDSQSITQAGVACTDSARPVYDGPESDPNTGHNTSFEVFHSDQYEIASTRYDGDFSFGPTDEAWAILRNDGVVLLIAGEALDGCTDPTAFMVGSGGIDFVSLPEVPGGTYSVGVPPTTTTSTTSTTSTTVAASGTSGSSTTDSTLAGPTSERQPTASTSDNGTTVPWLVAIGLGIISALGGLLLLRTPESMVPVSGFEKGTAPAGRVMS